MRVGMGYDVHRLVPGRPLILCGTPIPSKLGLDGHSDADVAVHALMDALLGAAGLGDIGRHFPDTDEKYKGISTSESKNTKPYVYCIVILLPLIVFTIIS